MKQNPPAAKTPLSVAAVVVASIAFALFVSACAKLPLRASASYSGAVKLEQAPVIGINTASAQELEKLPGIGKGIAERIIAHRERYGQFRRAEHLMMVRGISDRKFRAIQPIISVD